MASKNSGGNPTNVLSKGTGSSPSSQLPKGSPGGKSGRFSDHFVQSADRVAPHLPQEIKKILGLAILSSSIGQKIWLSFYERVFYPNLYFIFMGQWVDNGLQSMAKSILIQASEANVVDQEMFGVRTILRGLQESQDTFEHKRVERTHSHCSAILHDNVGDYLFSGAMINFLHVLFDRSEWQRGNPLSFRFMEHTYKIMNPYFSLILFTSKYLIQEKILQTGNQNNLGHWAHFLMVENHDLDLIKFPPNPCIYKNMEIIGHLRNITRRTGPLLASSRVRKKIQEFISSMVKGRRIKRAKSLKESIFYQQAPALFIKLVMIVAIDKGHWEAVKEDDVLEAKALFFYFHKIGNSYIQEAAVEDYDAFDILEELKRTGRATLEELEKKFERGGRLKIAKMLESLMGMAEVRMKRKNGVTKFIPLGRQWAVDDGAGGG